MAYIVTRKENENPDQLMVRFNKATSHFAKGQRSTQRWKRNDSRLKRKIAALVRESYRARRRKMQHYA